MAVAHSMGFPRIGADRELKKALETQTTVYLFIFMVVVYFWFRGLYRFERDLQRWNDPEYRRARMIADLWPALMEANRERIRRGEAISLPQLTEDILE